MSGYSECKLNIADKLQRANRKFPVGTEIANGTYKGIVVSAIEYFNDKGITDRNAFGSAFSGVGTHNGLPKVLIAIHWDHGTYGSQYPESITYE